MPRKKRPLERSEGVDRDASLIVIACEDKYAPKVYFNQFVTSRVQFKVLPTEDCRSSPDQIVQPLRTYKDEFQLGGSDQLWYLGDLDDSATPSPCGATNDECEGLPKVQFSLSGNHSDVAKHIQDAIAAGKPKKLRYDVDKANRKARRAIPCPDGRCSPGLSCDEYPFASTHQGGSGASWRCVPPGTNSSQAG